MRLGWVLCAIAGGTLSVTERIEPIEVPPLVQTEAVAKDSDDPALWVNRKQRERSLILGTDKAPAPDGALYGFDLNGKRQFRIAGLDRPNNVDVEYGFRLGGKTIDIAVVTERGQRRLRIFQIRPDGTLTDLSAEGGARVFEHEPGERAAPMGVGLYRRPSDGTVFAIVSRKEGPREGYLWQYRLEDDGAGRVRAVRVRVFGAFSGTKEIEAVAVDDALGYVYYADERDSVRKYHADPDQEDAQRELARFATSGFEGDREGIGVYTQPGGRGYLVCTDQIESGVSAFHLFRREGEPNAPHDHSRTLGVVRGGAIETDGLEVSSERLRPDFPGGIVAAMNDREHNFFLYAWSGFRPKPKTR